MSGGENLLFVLLMEEQGLMIEMIAFRSWIFFPIFMIESFVLLARVPRAVKRPPNLLGNLD